VRAGSKLIRYVSLVRQIWLENVVRIGFESVKEVIFGEVEQVGDGRDVVAAVPEPFSASQQIIKTRSVGSQTHPRPCWRRVLKLRNMSNYWRRLHSVAGLINLETWQIYVAYVNCGQYKHEHT